MSLRTGDETLRLMFDILREIPGELSRKLDIFTCKNNMLSSHVKISPLLWIHNKSRLSHQKTIKLKWFGILLVFM